MLSDYTGIWLLYLGLLFLATVLFVPMGLAGVLMLHAPAWRAHRLAHLTLPYARVTLAALLTAVGVIGLLEMVHFLVTAPASATGQRLFWTTIAVRTARPWLAFAALTVAGSLALRWAGPRAAVALAEANRPA
jgi:branched-chain amino acid transport system permease protein